MIATEYWLERSAAWQFCFTRTPTYVLSLLTEAAELLVQFGPPRDREFLELAETVHLEAIARLRLGQVALGPAASQ